MKKRIFVCEWQFISSIEYAGHAREYVRTIKLADWNGIVVVSGDGLIYEVNRLENFFEL